MNSDFPFLYEGDSDDNRRRGGWDNDEIHRETDNLTPDQHLKDEVMSAYMTYMLAMGLDPDKHTLNFEIQEDEDALGRMMPVIDQAIIHNMLHELGDKLSDNLDESLAVTALIPSLRLSIRASNLPQRTKDLSLEKLDAVIEMTAGNVDQLLVAVVMIKELNALINTSAAIENERLKNSRESKAGNNLLGNAEHDGDVQ